MKKLLAIAAMTLMPVSAAAQQADWASAPVVEVTLSSFAFAPATLHLRADRPVILRLVNSASGGHNFKAPEFFSAATVRAGDRAALRDGGIELGGGATRDIALVPHAGRYKLRCTHTFHTTFGMRGDIVVE